MTSESLAQGLYLLASPIGHLGDLSPRLKAVLADCDLVAAEDTRRSLKLLNHLDLKKPLISYREQNHAVAWPKIENVLAQDGRVALLSDAGAPTLADPGVLLVQAARAKGYKIWPIPGPSAVVTALMASGFWAERFIFGGFLPVKSAERVAIVKKLDDVGLCVVYFETPHRLLASLKDLAKTLGPRSALLAREMTKVHEEYLFGELPELLANVKAKPRQGEITLVIGPKAKEPKPELDWEPAVADVLEGGDEMWALKGLATELAAMTKKPKKDIYARLLKMSNTKLFD
ncbi:MAG: 16S rRNA (cytidine(1402)-2'-O)-methyltransferase [Deltaproteobacteria bacterium]|jgi:16S rRNA (cytidine1402-2'-O)-methyltransferase|nr:16S rRNA (cytidine(1402)-2'-O)-methyltransferase [Deltaproteobacteria bacterium]